jgi:hypothetical protein
MRQRIAAVTTATAALVFMLPWALGAGAQVANPMRSLLGALLELLPYSLDEARWESPANTAAIDQALADLAAHAGTIQQHGMGLNRSYGRARDGLAADAREAQQAFRGGEARLARFVVRNLTEDCFACHSRLPAGTRAELAGSVERALDIEQVAPADRVRLLVATRQFEAAMTAAENIMEDRTVAAVDIDGYGLFEDYLKVALRVSRDYDRPRTALWRFLQRDDVPMYLADRVGDWLAALEQLGRASWPVDLAVATNLLTEANARNEFVRDRRGLVHAILASSLLLQFVQSAPDDPLQLAEAYYWLGVAETAISNTLWVPEIEYFLETSIRLAPESAFARKAYSFLEQYVLASYTGSAGTNLPDDVWDRLMQLRQLIEGD